MDKIGKTNLEYNKRPNALAWLFSGIFLLLFSLILSVLLITISYIWINPPLTWLMVDRYFFDEKTQFNEVNHQWVSIDSISQHMIQAVVAAEDNNFMVHRGFDFEEIRKAQEERRTGKRIRGASTISMQVSKNVFLWHGRTWTRKFLEAGFTVIIENLWSKKRIMEVYLNIAELGPSIYGVEVASQAYFKKPASKLTRNEAALMVTVLPNPLRRNPSAPSAYMRSYQQRVLWNMRNIGEVKFPQKKTNKSG